VVVVVVAAVEVARCRRSGQGVWVREREVGP